MRLLWKLKRNQAEIRLISEFIDTYLDLTARENIEYETLRGELDKTELEAVMEFETSWKREGFKEGLQQGLELGCQEGRQEGRLEIILRLLNLRLGKVDAAVETQIRGISAGQLDDLCEALLEFSNQTDLAHWLETHG